MLVSSFSLPFPETHCLEKIHSLEVPLAKPGIPIPARLSRFGACLPACLGLMSMLSKIFSPLSIRCQEDVNAIGPGLWSGHTSASPQPA